MRIDIGNNNEIKNSIIGSKNNKEIPKEDSKSNLFKIIIEIIIGIIVGVVVGFIIYKFKWN